MVSPQLVDVTLRRLWDACKGQLSAWADRIRSLTYHFVFRNPSTVAVMVRDLPLLRKGEIATTRMGRQRRAAFRIRIPTIQTTIWIGIPTGRHLAPGIGRVLDGH
jgi:hypothetical protein